jgi:hypothetical protein
MYEQVGQSLLQKTHWRQQRLKNTDAVGSESARMNKYCVKYELSNVPVPKSHDGRKVVEPCFKT